MLVMILLFTGPGVTIGILSPMGIRVLARDADRLGKISGRVYGASALGSIAGALLVVFVLMSLLPNRAILFGAASLLILAGGIRGLLASPNPVSVPAQDESTGVHM